MALGSGDGTEWMLARCWVLLGGNGNHDPADRSLSHETTDKSLRYPRNYRQKSEISTKLQTEV